MNQKTETRKRNPLLPVVIILLAAVIVLAALLLQPEEQPAPLPAEPVPTETAAAVVPTTEETEPEIPDVEVETPYCVLRYPGEWEGRISVEQYPFDVGMSVMFFGSIDGVKIELYSVHFGGTEGIPVGSIQSPEGYLMDVTVQMADFAGDGDWAPEKADELSAMQETMNYVIERLKEEVEIITAP